MVEDDSTLPPYRIERRQYPRIAVEPPGYLRLDDGATSVIVEELSAGGATVNTSKHFPFSVTLTLQIEGAGDFEAEQAWWSKDHDVRPKTTDTGRETRETVRVGSNFPKYTAGFTKPRGGFPLFDETPVRGRPCEREALGRLSNGGDATRRCEFKP